MPSKAKPGYNCSPQTYFSQGDDGEHFLYDVRWFSIIFDELYVFDLLWRMMFF